MKNLGNGEDGKKPRNTRRCIEDLLEAKRLRAELDEYDEFSKNDPQSSESYDDLINELYDFEAKDDQNLPE